jgi:hypothetical protein
MNPDTFFLKMKKKASVQNVLDNISSYTEEDIDLLEGSHFPQWIKEQLKKLVRYNGKSSQQVAEEIAEKMIQASRTQ